MTKLESLMKKVSERRSEEVMPEDWDDFLSDFIPNQLFKDDTFQKALEITEEEMEDVYREAYFFYQKGEYETSAHLFRGLAILNPYRPRYWLGLGGSLQLTGKYEAALKAYGVIVLLEPEDPAPLEQIHECYRALGDEEAAMDAFEKLNSLKIAKS